jgi:hypothetical protein
MYLADLDRERRQLQVPAAIVERSKKIIIRADASV